MRGLEAALTDAGVDVVALRERRLDPWRFDRRVLWDQVLLPRALHAQRSEPACIAPRGRSRCFGACRSSSPCTTSLGCGCRHTRRPYARYYFGGFALARYRSAAKRSSSIPSFRDGELLRTARRLRRRARARRRIRALRADFCGVERSGGRRPHDSRRRHGRAPQEPRAVLCARSRTLPARASSRSDRRRRTRRHARSSRSDLGVADRVEFRGYVSRDGLLALYATLRGCGGAVAATKASATRRRKRCAPACRASSRIAAALAGGGGRRRAHRCARGR